MKLLAGSCEFQLDRLVDLVMALLPPALLVYPAPSPIRFVVASRGLQTLRLGSNVAGRKPQVARRKFGLRPAKRTRRAIRKMLAFGALAGLLASVDLFALRGWALQKEAAKPVVVQPGAPGQPTKTLPASTKGTLPPLAPADVEFMQGMIMHHAQAIEMTAMIASRSENKDLRLLGARISASQADEIKFMKRWLAARGQPTSMAMPGMPDMDRSGRPMTLMPGMLTAEQMDALRKAKSGEFDRLFLEGMIQHHGGALTMVKDLFNTAGAGQDAELFAFATDVDTGQRAEIRIMQSMLEKAAEEKP
jgi:uncharacterized protein (DUF305 family)